MKYFFTLLIVLALIAGCNLQENYSMNYAFTDQVVSQTMFTTSTDGFSIRMPLLHIACDQAVAKATLERTGQHFDLIILDPNEQQDCMRQFSATVTGVLPGSYTMRVLQRTERGDVPLYTNTFSF